jgi:hypothetical protein
MERSEVRKRGGDAGCDDDCSGRKLVLTGANIYFYIAQG